MKFRDFVAKYGQPYSSMLGINLKLRKNQDAVKWFMAAILYSKPIRQSSATRTYECFERRGITTARRILSAGWDQLVKMLDEGGYTRYDFSTADKLLEVFGNLEKWYGGDLFNLYERSTNSVDLEANLRKLGKGIGDTTVSIFLRDMRYVWKKADPKPTPLVTMALSELRIADLKKYVKKHRIDPVRLETALFRYSKDFLKRGRPIRITT